MRHARRTRAEIVNKIGPVHSRGKQRDRGETAEGGPLGRVRKLPSLLGEGD